MIKKISIILLVMLLCFGREVRAGDAADLYTVITQCLEGQVGSTPQAYAAGMADCLGQSDDNYFDSQWWMHFGATGWFFATGFVVVPISVLFFAGSLVTCLMGANTAGRSFGRVFNVGEGSSQ